MASNTYALLAFLQETGVVDDQHAAHLVAEMAAEGLSNPEIAQSLFVTRKTVEAHLGNAYRKLDIRSRGELPAALRVSAG